MKIKQIRKLIQILGITGLILVFLSYFSIIFGVIGIVLACLAIAVDLIFYKWPHCGRHLGKNGGDFCQYCGKSIDE